MKRLSAQRLAEDFVKLSTRWAGLVRRIEQHRPFHPVGNARCWLSSYLAGVRLILGGTPVETIEFLADPQDPDPLLAEILRSIPDDERDDVIHYAITKLRQTFRSDEL